MIHFIEFTVHYFIESIYHIYCVTDTIICTAAALSLELSAGEDGSEEDALVDEDVSLLWDALWPHLQCYLVPEDDYTRWYMMDEV